MADEGTDPIARPRVASSQFSASRGSRQLAAIVGFAISAQGGHHARGQAKVAALAKPTTALLFAAGAVTASLMLVRDQPWGKQLRTLLGGLNTSAYATLRPLTGPDRWWACAWHTVGRHD